MNKQRIEELASELFAMECTMSEIVGALQIVVRETREEDSDKCEQMALYTGVDCAAAIRKLGEE